MRRCEVTICQMAEMRKAFRRLISTTACSEKLTTPRSSPTRMYSCSKEPAVLPASSELLSDDDEEEVSSRATYQG